MRNNYYDIEKRNNRRKNQFKRKSTKNVHASKINKLSSEKRRESNCRKRKAKKLNYKKIFVALLVLTFFIYLAFSGFSKLVSHVKKPSKVETTSTVESKPQDITINMAVIR